MWIQTRNPSPSRLAETASSKSRALAGSTVKVGSRGQIAARACVPLESLDRPPGLLLDPVAKGRAQPAIGDQGADHVAGVVGATEVDDRLAAAAVEATERDSARVDLDPAAGQADLRAAVEQRLTDVELAAAGDDQRPRAPGIERLGHQLPV